MKIVIVDDDRISLEHMEYQLNKLTGLEVVASFLDPMEGQAYILENDVDAVLLDAHFPGVTGLTVSEEIHLRKPDVIIALVSSYDKYAVDAFELNIIDYILKPVEINRLEITINRIRKQLKPIEQKLLHLQVANRFEFIVDSKFEPIAWRTAKTQELFLYLLQHNEAPISKADLMEVLWPEGKESFSILYTTIHHVRAVLESYKSYITLNNYESGYQLTLNNVRIDLVEWENDILSLPDISSASINEYELSMKKNTEAYLDEHSYIWAEAEEYRLEELWTSAALEIAKYYKYNQEFEEAIRWYVTICERNPVEERAYFSLMEIYNRYNQWALVKKHYNYLKVVLQEELDVEPSEYITNWFKNREEAQSLLL